MMIVAMVLVPILSTPAMAAVRKKVVQPTKTVNTVKPQCKNGKCHLKK
jgi:hypothetical protein